MGCTHSEDSGKKGAGRKVPGGSGLEKKSFPSVRKWDVTPYCRQSENASLQIRSTGNTTAERNAQAAEGQDHSERQQKSQHCPYSTTQLNSPSPLKTHTKDTYSCPTS